MGLATGPGVCEWVAGRLGAKQGYPNAVGIGWEKGGRLVAGAVFTHYNGTSIHMHIAGGTPAPTFVAAIMDYPFNQAGVRRVTGMIAASNEASCLFAEHLGAVHEGTMREALPDGDLLVYRLLREDAERWLTAPYARRLRGA